jgi:hypothetical protein
VKPASAKPRHSASQHRMHKVSLLTCAIWTSFAVVTGLKSGRPRLRGGVCPSPVVPSTRSLAFNRRRRLSRKVFPSRAKSSSDRAPLRTLVSCSKRTSVALRSVREPKAGRSRHLYRKGHCGERLDCRRAGSHRVRFRLDGLRSFTNSKWVLSPAKSVFQTGFALTCCDGTCSTSRTWWISAAISARKDWRAFFSCSPILTGRLPRTPAFQTSIMRPWQRWWALRGRGFAVHEALPAIRLHRPQPLHSADTNPSFSDCLPCRT